jgi:hypothetical protein
MKLRQVLKNFRLRSVQLGEGERSVGNVDALTTMTHSGVDQGGNIPVTAPPNWVPSQQDDRPRH